METVEFPEDQNSPQVEAQEPEEERKGIVETEHTEISQELGSPAVEEDVADIPTEEPTPEAIKVQSDVLPLENEDRVDSAAEVADDNMPIVDEVKEVETSDIDVKEPEERVVDEKSEIGIHLNYYKLISSGA